MKIAAIIVRSLLGLLFVVFGSNAFLHFIPMPEMSGPSGAFIGAMAGTGYLQVVAACQIIGGALLLVGMVPLGLMALGPIIVNILLFHVFLDKNGLGMAIGIAVCSLLLLWHHRASFASLLKS